MEFNNLAKVLEEYGQFLVQEMRSEMSQKGVNASGKLSNSIHYIFSTDNGDYSVSLGLEDYYQYILKDGRGPTRNSGNGQLRDRIKEWIEVKHIIPQPDRNGKIPTVEQLSYLIARKIHREGYKGSGIWQSSIEATNQMYMDKIDEAITKDVGEYVDQILHLHLKGI